MGPYLLWGNNSTVSMALCKTAVTPLLTHWSYCSLALSHQYVSVPVASQSGRKYKYISMFPQNSWAHKWLSDNQTKNFRYIFAGTRVHLPNRQCPQLLVNLGAERWQCPNGFLDQDHFYPRQSCATDWWTGKLKQDFNNSSSSSSSTKFIVTYEIHSIDK